MKICYRSYKWTNVLEIYYEDHFILNQVAICGTQPSNINKNIKKIFFPRNTQLPKKSKYSENHPYTIRMNYHHQPQMKKLEFQFILIENDFSLKV